MSGQKVPKNLMTGQVFMNFRVPKLKYLASSKTTSFLTVCNNFFSGVLHCSLTSIWLCFLPGFLMLIVGDSHTGNAHQLQYASKLVMPWLNTFFMRNSSQKLVLNFLTNYNRNMLGYCSHNSRE